MRRRIVEVIILAIVSLTWVPLSHAQAEEEEQPPQLLGVVTAEQLAEDPYSEWSRSGFDDYIPAPAILERLRTIDFKDTELKLYFGTWCGDSQREVPRILKVLDELDFPKSNIQLIALDGDGKVSPGGEERGREIYRVPTLIVERKGQEVTRLVEYPAVSLERDLLAILDGRDYQPNYPSYPIVRRWLSEGLLSDPNVSARGLASELRYIITTEGELAAAALVMLARGETAEAIKLFHINQVLHRDSVRSSIRLARAYIEGGDLEQARKWAERAVEQNDDPDRVSSLLELIAESSP